MKGKKIVDIIEKIMIRSLIKKKKKKKNLFLFDLFRYHRMANCFSLNLYFFIHSSIKVSIETFQLHQVKL